MGPKRREYMALLEQGYSYVEIAEKCGVTRQNVYASVKKYKRKEKPHSEKKRTYVTDIEEQVIYPGIADYMRENNLSVNGLAKRCGITSVILYKLLNGSQKMRERHIKALTEGTGCSYEQLFKED